MLNCYSIKGFLLHSMNISRDSREHLEILKFSPEPTNNLCDIGRKFMFPFDSLGGIYWF